MKIFSNMLYNAVNVYLPDKIRPNEFDHASKLCQLCAFRNIIYRTTSGSRQVDSDLMLTECKSSHSASWEITDRLNHVNPLK